VRLSGIDLFFDLRSLSLGKLYSVGKVGYIDFFNQYPKIYNFC